MNCNSGIYDGSLKELTAAELFLVSGAMEQEEQPNQDAGALSGLVFAVASGAVYGGIGAAITSAMAGGNWGAAGAAGMVAGGVVGGLQHLNGK